MDAWARWAPPRGAESVWDPDRCREDWRRGRPLVAETPLDLRAADLEDTMAVAMEAVTVTRPEEVQALRLLADEWDAGRLGPAAFLPSRGAVGETVSAQLALRPEVAAFLAYAGLRPALAWWFAGARPSLGEGTWALGVCPFCGAPAGFADIVEDGRRRLSCHLCAGEWIFSRVRCPLCGADGPGDLVRLEPAEADQAYFVSACPRCKGYVKEIDRRLRWNARAPLVEDWGSPHLDLIARRQGYWRAMPTLVEVAAPA